MLAVEKTTKHPTPRKRKSDLTRLVEKMPPDSVLTINGKTWRDYETLIDEIGEASGRRVSFRQGTLEIMTLSIQHEYFSALLQDLIRILSLRKKIKVLFFRSATMKKTGILEGAEPDNTLYVQSADKLPQMPEMDYGKDVPPDIIVEIDIHHKSESKNPTYAAFGMGEIWRYNGKKMRFFRLNEAGQYLEIERSAALPILTAETLTKFLNDSKTQDQYEILLAFEDWLEKQ